MIIAWSISTLINNCYSEFLSIWKWFCTSELLFTGFFYLLVEVFRICLFFLHCYATRLIENLAPLCQNHQWHARTRFPALRNRTVLIGSLDCLCPLWLASVITWFCFDDTRWKPLLHDIAISQTLFSYISQVQHAMKKSEAALMTINKAMTIDPKNPLCKFHRASILFSMDKHQV